MGNLENIKTVDRMINTVTFWLAIAVAIVLLIIGIHYTYEQVRYEETNDAQVQEEINPVVSRISGYVKEIRFEENQEVRKGDTLATIDENKEHMAIISPYHGKIGRRTIHTGQYIPINQTIAYVVDKDQGKWIVADFKETQISHLHIGQYVDIETDAFPGQIYRGRILSISPATGSSFSVLPADNLTGNFVKVVQRIPVKIAFTDPAKVINQLATGMSAAVKTRK